MIQQGFGASYYGEDQYDAFIGLLGMINIIMGNHATGDPLVPPITSIEGWIFRQVK